MSIRFYFKRGRWRVTSDRQPVRADEWWAAINQVKCLNHKLRMKDADTKARVQANPDPQA